MELNEFIKVTDTEYHTHPYVGSHKFMQLLKSYKHMQTYAPKETPAMRFGRLVHKAVLEPEDFLLHMKIIPECDKRTKAGKELYEAFLATTVETDLLVTPSELETFQRMIESAQKKESFKTIVDDGGCLFEHAAFFDGWLSFEDRTAPFPTKIKPDIVNPSKGYLVDLKTCVNAKEFKRDLFRYGYHFQAAFYQMHTKLVTDKECDFYFIAIEKDAPYELMVYKLSTELLNTGRTLIGLANQEFLTNRGGYKDVVHSLEVSPLQNDSQKTLNWNFESEAVW